MNPPLFPYTLRRSLRARRVQLRVTLQGGLEVAIPRGFNPAGIPAVLERMQAWIRSALDRVAEARRQARPAPPWLPPAQLVLPAVGRAWRVEIRPEASGVVSLQPLGEGALLLAGETGHEAACRTVLRRWLLGTAKRHLPAMLHEASRAAGLPFAGVTVRLARTRWGSCSRRHTISLNARLLLLPPEVVRYVLLHELCHTRELNHGPAFWRLLAAHCPEFAERRARLRRVSQETPYWAEAAPGRPPPPPAAAADGESRRSSWPSSSART